MQKPRDRDLHGQAFQRSCSLLRPGGQLFVCVCVCVCGRGEKPLPREIMSTRKRGLLFFVPCTFNCNGSFNKAISKQIAQAKREEFSFLQKARRLNLPLDVQCELFELMVMPILLYGCEVWGRYNITHIKIFHHKFLKQILHLNKRTANHMVLGETGTYPIRDFIDKRMVNFWLRIVSGKQN